MQATVQTTESSKLKSGESVKKAPKVLLAETYRWPFTALFALDLAKAGCDISFVCPSHHPVLKTRAVRQIFRYSGLRPLQSLEAAIDATGPDLIIPCDDRAVEHLHELHNRARIMGAQDRNMAALVEKSLGSPESYAVVSSRYNLLKIAREEGLRVPDTERINSESDLQLWQGRQAFPWVLKADGTYGGHGVRMVQTRKQAASFLTELIEYYTASRAIKRLCINRDAFWLRPWWKGVKPIITVQSYIHGKPANCAVVCWNGTVLAGVGVDVLSSAGTTGPAGVVRVSDNPDMMLCAAKIARRLNLSGFFGLDFVIEEGTGLTWLIEMNPRPTRVSRLQLGKGRDQVGALLAQLKGQPARELPPVTQNKMIAYFPDAWDAKSELLDLCYHDIPDGGPELVEELRSPWPTRTLLWRLMKGTETAESYLRKYLVKPEQANQPNWTPPPDGSRLAPAKLRD
ncbi:MAG TPA: ATP-grasp domain-containing protein [Verrucomicrobiae bacterium]|nr:ATP-grasp domain-containing protein [Verrucomicrobiae bacterium]